MKPSGIWRGGTSLSVELDGSLSHNMRGPNTTTVRPPRLIWKGCDEMIFSDAMDAVRSTLSEGTDLTPYDNLNTAYTEFEEASNAKVAELTEQIAALQGEITELKSVNYDLLMASSGAGQTSEDEETEDAGEDDNADENIDEFLERTAQ